MRFRSFFLNIFG